MAVAKPATEPENTPATAAPKTQPTVAVKPAATLRAVQVHKLTVGRFKPVGHFSEPQQAVLPADWDFSDAMVPEFWTFIAPSMQANPSAGSLQDRIGTVIEVRAEDHAYLGLLYVRGLRRNAQGQADALDVICIGPMVDPETGAGCAVDLKTGKPWRGRKGA